MDDIVVRSRYQRHRNYDRRRKKNNMQSDTNIAQKLLMQIFICILLLALIFFINKVNTPVTNYLNNKVAWSMSWDMNFGGITGKVKSFTDGLFKKGSESSNNSASSTNTRNAVLDSTGKGSTLLKSIIAPVEGTVETPFGERVNNLKGGMEFHRGIDLTTNGPSNVKAALDGEVVEKGLDKAYGNYIKIKHQYGIVTVYGCCSEIVAAKGQKVKQGDTIAKIMEAEAGMGTHLHFEIWIDDTNLNPEDFF